MMKATVQILILIETVLLFLGIGIAGMGREVQEASIDIQIATRVAKIKLAQLDNPTFNLRLPGETICDDRNIENRDQVLFYQFDLEPQGYLVVAGHYNLPPVIAYSFTSDYFSGVTGEHVLHEFLVADLRLRLANLAFLSEEIKAERKAMWNQWVTGNPNGFSGRAFQQWPPSGSTPTGGWLESNWTQNAPYNNFCPIDLSSGTRSVAGCPSVAMAMIMNYHETINNVLFDDADDYYHAYGGNNFQIDDAFRTYDFPSWPELNSYLATLADHYINQIPLTHDDKAALTYACGVAARQVYNPGGSGTFGVDQAYDAYRKFNCQSVKLLDETAPYLYDRLADNMKAALPAHIAVVDVGWTMGHNMVVDGYNTDDYFHINFGWGGSYNGWYQLPDDLPYSLTVLEGMVLDIMNEQGILWADTNSLSAGTGGTVNFHLDAGEVNQGRYYLILGTVSGTQPGIGLPGGLATLPINWDSVTDIILGKLNTPVFPGFLATLDGQGRSSAQMILPPLPNYVGKTFHFAYCCNDPFDLVSNPVAVEML